MRKSTAILIVIIGVMFLTACQPSAQAIQEAIVQTQIVQTQTAIELPTIELTSESGFAPTTEPTPTSEPTPTPGPTPTNNPLTRFEIYDDKMINFFPSIEDMEMAGFKGWYYHVEPTKDELENYQVSRFSVVIEKIKNNPADHLEQVSAGIALYKSESDASAEFKTKVCSLVDSSCEIDEDTWVNGDQSHTNLFSSTSKNTFWASVQVRHKNIYIDVFASSIELATEYLKIFFNKLQTAKMVMPSKASFADQLIITGNEIIRDDMRNFFPSDEDLEQLGLQNWHVEDPINDCLFTSDDGFYSCIAIESDDIDAGDTRENITFHLIAYSEKHPYEYILYNNVLTRHRYIDKIENADLGDIYKSDEGTIYLMFLFNNVVGELIVKENQISQTKAEDLVQITLNKLQTAKLVEPINSSEETYIDQSVSSSKSDKTYGFYLVGSEIAAGNWRSSGNSDNCYWSITDSKGEIINNHFGMAGGAMYIPSNAFQVELDKECGTWEYLGK